MSASQKLKCAAIKSWRRADEAALLSGLEGFANRLSTPLALDLLSAGTAETSRRLKAMHLALVRSSPSESLANRIGRLVGIHTKASMINAVVCLRHPSELRSLLEGSLISEADFVLFAKPFDFAGLPNPHVDFDHFSRRVDWSLMQETGSYTWKLTAFDGDSLKRVTDLLVDSLRHQGLQTEVDSTQPTFPK